ncbi:NAD(P)/FAD-dependent oxidoreductase [Aestuariibacter sp. AA17]|uniref:NAD(P)/FAD-dependent oxidoreductase n=1 Tax=Fluctibacter corallii TaxID=2984329 RepID=A0ABT3A3W9_9ALTE|nr:NAD(P)/FAD-dependent oxidoreductase [Aestuariibacter sp. AA17]MCV2883383.1 NAD(P)/FAD-dependent oxidoreductase [Aestuariibacter sp. AA17]
MKKIIVVGGGAGGFELVTRLSKTLGKRELAEIILVDRSRTHIWKPLLHEVAAGVIDKSSDGVDYAIHASRHHYQFIHGTLQGIDRDNKTIRLAALNDEQGDELLPERDIDYDYLVLAIGSVSNDFGTQGVAEHCYFLDSIKQAERFHKALLNHMFKLNQQSDKSSRLSIAIVGGGATGIELAATLNHVAELASTYGMPDISAERMHISVIEAGNRILPALPERIANSARGALQKLGVKVWEDTKVKAAKSDGFVTADDVMMKADLMVWAAGVKAPDFLAETGDFALNRAQQICVNAYLQSSVDDSVFVLGDCCGFEQRDGSWVPPRAQSAHQMADIVAKNLNALFENKPLHRFKYVDYGSLVHLSKYSTVGSLMGKLSSGSMFIEGKLARLVYISLYNMHILAIHGRMKGLLTLLIRKVGHAFAPKLKLH